MFRTSNSLIKIVVQRHQFSTSAVLMQQMKQQQQGGNDPIKQAFADKVREYAQKQKALGDQKLVDANPEVNKAYQEELDRVHRTYQVKSQEDFVKFPSLQFDESKIDPVDLHDQKQEDNLRW